MEPVRPVDGKTLKALLAEREPDEAWLAELTELRAAFVVDDDE